MPQPESKCGECQRTAATHAPGCSRIECPERKAHAWCGTEGSHGFPGLLAEDRVLVQRRSEAHRAVAVELNDL